MRQPITCTLALAAASLLAACSGVRVEGDSSFRFSPEDRYAWRPSSRTVSGDEGIPVEAMRRAIDRELGERGLRVVPRAQAGLLLELNLGVETKVVSNDPYFDLYAREMREDGVVRLEVTDAETDAKRWAGETRVRLRFSAHSMTGVIGSDWVETDKPRQWRIREVASRLLAGR